MPRARRVEPRRPQCHKGRESSGVTATSPLFPSLLGQFLKTPSHRTDTMGSTSPCCWPGLGFSCRTTASSPTWTTCTTNTQVGLQQPNLFLPTPPKLRRAPHDLPTAGTSIVFDMSLTYILVALVAVILNNALVELLSLHTRISVGELGSPCPRALPAPP